MAYKKVSLNEILESVMTDRGSLWDFEVAKNNMANGIEINSVGHYTLEALILMESNPNRHFVKVVAE